jgi:hypothetical protein
VADVDNRLGCDGSLLIIESEGIGKYGAFDKVSLSSALVSVTVAFSLVC